MIRVVRTLTWRNRSRCYITRWWDADSVGMFLERGPLGSDPVWTVGVELRHPLLDRIGEWLWKVCHR